jgi:septal ring factor EnvC (AmiA/AmiB activator)
VVTYSRYILLALLIITLISPQDYTISEKEAELSLIKNEIQELEKELGEKSSAEKRSFEAVDNLGKQGFLINKVINSLRVEINAKQKGIDNTKKKLSKTESEIKILMDSYARYIVALYKKGSYNELEALVDASSLQQALLRLHYLQEFSEKREKDLEKLEYKRTELADLKRKLEFEKRQKSDLTANKEKEYEALQIKLNERKSILAALQNNTRELRKNISVKKESQKQIEELIVQLIEAERIRKEAELKNENQIAAENNTGDDTEERTTGSDYNFDTSTFASFSNLKGKMIMPLHKGKIIRKFGENKNKKLNTVTLNYGIDIKAGVDYNVRCVGEGIVSAIDWLPGYGNVIIVSHKENYRTVYGHLSEIFVSEGDVVKGGKVLAKVDETIEGKVLHFEIWQARDKHNPELWLARK